MDIRSSAWKVSAAKARELQNMNRGDLAYPVEAVDTISFRHVDVQKLGLIPDLRMAC